MHCAHRLIFVYTPVVTAVFVVCKIPCVNCVRAYAESKFRIPAFSRACHIVNSGFKLRKNSSKPVVITCYTIASNELINQKRLGEHIFTLPKNDRIQLSRVLIGQFLSALTLHRSLTSKTFADLPESFAFALRGMNELKFAAEGMPAFLRLSNFSHAQLCRLTKKYLGKTPSEIITEIRMSYAWELVTCSDLDCEAVSEAVGFKSYSHFCLIFLKTYGKTPSKARHDTID